MTSTVTDILLPPPALGRRIPLAALESHPDGPRCRCRHGSECQHPGAHPLHERWWTPDPDPVPLSHQRAAAPAILLPPHLAALQLPAPLAPAAHHWLSTRPIAAPAVATCRRTWVWILAPTSLRTPVSYPRLLPDATRLMLLRPGAWLPTPGAHLPDEGDVTWAALPTGRPLHLGELNRLLAHLRALRLRHGGHP